MKLLDLKKLMLVPIVCCVLVQQTDAEVVLDISTTAELKEKQQNDNGFVGDEDKQVEWFTDRVKQLDAKGKTAGLNDNVSVAPELGSLAVGSGKGNKDGNVMGGVIAFIASDWKGSAFYQGSKASYCKVTELEKKIGGKKKNAEESEELERLKANSKHTEVQLLTKAKADYERWKGQAAADAIVHIYTHSAPCSGRHGNANCCAFYSSTAAANGWVKAFHIYFDKPTCAEFGAECLKHINTEGRLKLFTDTLGQVTMDKVDAFLDKISVNGTATEGKKLEAAIDKYIVDERTNLDNQKPLKDVAAKGGWKLRLYYTICRKKDNLLKMGKQTNLDKMKKGEKMNEICQDVARLIMNAISGLNIGGERIGDGDSLAKCYKDIIFEYAKSNQNGTQGQTIKDRFNFHILARTE